MRGLEQPEEQNEETKANQDQNEDTVKIIIESFTQADQEGSLISVGRSYDHITGKPAQAEAEGFNIERL